jgi:ribosomal protein S18 acetylase RimI-like enzyme
LERVGERFLRVYGHDPPNIPDAARFRMVAGETRAMQFDGISLRAAGVDDAAALATVGSATFLESFAGILEGGSILMHCQRQHSAETYRKYLAQPETRAWLAVVPPGDAPIGYAMLTEPDLPLPDLTGEDIELKRIYVFSRYQRAGAGRMLFEQCLEAARAAGKRRLLLGVHAENMRALGFYRRQGFEQVGVRTFRIGEMVYDDLVLGRAIDA